MLTLHNCNETILSTYGSRAEERYFSVSGSGEPTSDLLFIMTCSRVQGCCPGPCKGVEGIERIAHRIAETTFHSAEPVMSVKRRSSSDSLVTKCEPKRRISKRLRGH